MRRRTLGASAFGAMMALGAGGYAQPYTTEILPPYGSAQSACHNSLAYALNEAGVAAGRSGTCPARWIDGQVDHLGGFGGTEGEALGINSLGHIVGYATTSGNSQARAFLYIDGAGMTDIGTLGGLETVAWAINDVGQIVGHASLPDDTAHAFLWTPNVPNGTTGTMLDLGLLNGQQTVATAVNNAGEVVGFSFQESPPGSGNYISRAFLYTPGSGMADLDDFGGVSASAWGINDYGDIVGEAENGSGVSHPFLWSGGSMTNLGLLNGLPSVAISINNNGDIVGGTTDDTYAFRYAPGVGLINLNTEVSPSVLVRQVVAVLADGRIAGWADIGASQDTRGVVLIP